MNFASSSFFYLRKAILFVCPFFSSFAFGAGNVAICMHAPIYAFRVLGIRVLEIIMIKIAFFLFSRSFLFEFDNKDCVFFLLFSCSFLFEFDHKDCVFFVIFLILPLRV